MKRFGKLISKIRKIDISLMKSTKYGDFGGIHARTSYTAFFVLDRILSLLRPNMIVEIGTWRGGLSCYLKAWGMLSSNGCQFLTVDIEDLLSDKTRLYLSNNRILQDALDEEAQEVIGDLVSNNVSLVYCDGGDKELELVDYSKFIQPGSIIGCHDYGTEVDPELMRKVLDDDLVELFTEEQIKKLGNSQQFWVRK